MELKVPVVFLHKTVQTKMDYMSSLVLLYVCYRQAFLNTGNEDKFLRRNIFHKGADIFLQSDRVTLISEMDLFLRNGRNGDFFLRI